MACEPDVATDECLWLSVSQRNLKAFLQSIAKQRVPPERLFKVIPGVISGCHIARKSIDYVTVESDYFCGAM